MAKRQVMFTFPTGLIKEPLIFQLGIKFNLLPNIRRADITEAKGWVALELEGNDKDIEAGISWLEEKGVRIDSANGDVLEG